MIIVNIFSQYHLVTCFVILAVLDRNPGTAGLRGSIARGAVGGLKI